MKLSPSGKPYVLPSVRAAEEKLLSQNLNHEYLPTHGCPRFRQAAKILAFGEDSVAIKDNLIASAQSISGLNLFHISAKQISFD